MSKFLFGMVTGFVVGGGVLYTLHPMNKRDMKKMLRRANKMICKMNCMLHGDFY